MTDAVSENVTKGRLARSMPGILLLLVMLSGAVSLIYAVAAGRIVFPPEPSARAFLTGELTTELSSDLAKTPFPAFMARLERGVSWMVMGSLGPRVRQGCPDWLFLTDELTVHPHAAKNGRLRSRTVAAVNQWLAGKDIELLVVIVPDKSRIQREQLCELPRPLVLDERLRSWMDNVSSAGVRIVDLEPVLSRQASEVDVAAPFLRTDTHWSELGAERAARQVAVAVERMRIDIQPSKQYKLEESAPQRREGDLVRLAGIEWLPSRLQPAGEWVGSPVFHEVDAPAASGGGKSQSADDDAGDLFGDENLPNIALIGTSFSRTSSFLGYLDYHLSTSVTSFARDGGDFWGAAKYYFASPSFLETPPRLVIWEIPERVLNMPMQPEECSWASEFSTDAISGEISQCIVN